MKGGQINISNKEDNYINGNMFIKIEKLKTLKASIIRGMINKAFNGFNGLKHYEIIHFMRESYIIFYYVNSKEKFIKKPKEFKWNILKSLISMINNKIYLELNEINGTSEVIEFRFFVRGKLIYYSTCETENLINYYRETLEYIKGIFKEDVVIIENKEVQLIIEKCKRSEWAFWGKGEGSYIIKEK